MFPGSGMPGTACAAPRLDRTVRRGVARGNLAQAPLWTARSEDPLVAAAGNAGGRCPFLKTSYDDRTLIILDRLSRSFHEGERVHRVLDGLSARIETGERVAIIGRSGSGKSTLLNIVSGIDHADSGAVIVDDQEVTALREPERTLFRRRHIGFVYQFFNLVPTLDVEENVRLALELNGIRGAEARKRSAAVLAEVGLRDRLHSAIDTLSGGEQQRVAIARAIVHEPRYLLADEPTGNLDEATAQQVFPLLTELVKKRGATMLLVTHERTLAHSADRVLELREGKLHPVGNRVQES
jgi:putative ABC transport system ATP-binding protein